MKRYFLPIICAALGLLPAWASAPEILRGTVMDAATGEPVAGVIVKGGGAFASTDHNGHFVLTMKAAADSISFRSMGYEALTLSASADLERVFLRQEPMQLRNVVVQAPDIYARGDTLVFNVSRYANATDNAIIDVIKRLPGIKVKPDGQIEYQGKPISKFYIDGNDFLGGQYGLATNNISHKDVKSVEVLENHQPVKALEGIEFPEEAGINLKLKEDARSRWVGVVQAAAGVEPVLADGSMFAMRIAPKIQNMFTLKADNTGWNPATEIRDHDLDMDFSGDYQESLWPEYISADITGAPLSEKRTRDNLSWLANAIAAWKAGDTSMRLKLNYMGDRLDYSSGVVTDYLSDMIPTLVQNNVQRTRRQELSAQFYSVTNKRNYYLKDKLTVAGDWKRSLSSVNGSYDLSQVVFRKGFSARNDLKLVKRNDKKLFTLSSSNRLVHRPDKLMLSGGENATQMLGITDFRSTTETRLGKLRRFWKYYLTAGIDLNHHRMNSILTGMGEFDNQGIHNAVLADLYLLPQVDYQRNGWRGSLRLPLKWLYCSVAGGVHDYLNVAPRLSVWRQLTSKSELSVSASYRLGSPPPYLNIDVPILADYRNMLISSNPDKRTQAVAASFAYRYRNPVKAFFANLTAGYNYCRSAIMANQIFVDDFIISTYADALSRSVSHYLKCGVSKGLGHSRVVVGADVDVQLSSARSMRNGIVIPYRQTVAGLKPYFKGSIADWLSLNYEGAVEYQKIGSSLSDMGTLNAHNSLFATIIPTGIVQFAVGAEQFFTRFPEGNIATLLLLDASAVWRIKNALRLSLTANNLLDRRNYEYVTYGTLSRSEHYFQLRRRTILASLQIRF
ncbi:MAG: TonB-dependent receptor [Bacteroides sp.]|nr:TonB-dependent receptor [Bacteroides sp.]